MNYGLSMSGIFWHSWNNLFMTVKYSDGVVQGEVKENMRAKINILCPWNKPTTRVVLSGISILAGNIWRSTGIECRTAGVKRTSRQSFAFFPIRPGRSRRKLPKRTRRPTLSNMSQASNNNSSWISKVSPSSDTSGINFICRTQHSMVEENGVRNERFEWVKGGFSLAFPRLQVLMLVWICPPTFSSKPDSLSFGNTRAPTRNKSKLLILVPIPWIRNDFVQEYYQSAVAEYYLIGNIKSLKVEEQVKVGKAKKRKSTAKEIVNKCEFLHFDDDCSSPSYYSDILWCPALRSVFFPAVLFRESKDVCCIRVTTGSSSDKKQYQWRIRKAAEIERELQIQKLFWRKF